MNLFDPTATVQNQFAGWVAQATGWAQHIYLSLLIFELIALGVTTLLFRENLGEFFASFSLKVFIGGVYFWFINNAGTGALWPQAVINMFKGFGISLGGTNATGWLAGEGLTAATAYFAAAPIAQAVGAGASQVANLPPNCVIAGALTAIGGYCDIAPILQFSTESASYQMITQGMALMIVMAIAAIWLQIVLITIESYLVMGAGILFIGFAGSRFTMPFSQGYFSYMLNVGVKFMVLYVVLGIEQQLMPGILASAAATIGASFLPYGEYLALVPAAVGLVNVVIAAALVWTIPGFAGSFLSGQSSASGSAALGQAMGSMASASAMMAQMHQGQRNDALARSTEQGHSLNGHTTGTQLQALNSGAGSATNQQPFSPVAASQAFEGRYSDASESLQPAFAQTSGPAQVSSDTPSAIGYSPNSATSLGIGTGTQRSGSNIYGPAPGVLPVTPAPSMQYQGYGGAPQSSFGAPSSMNDSPIYATKPLDEYKPDEIAALSDRIPEFKRAYAASNPYDLTAAQTDAIKNDPALSKAADQVSQSKSYDAQADAENARTSAENARTNAELARAYGMSALAQGAPRDIGQPSAVQIRLGSADRL